MNIYLPDNHEEITERIILKCKNLIELKYWDKIKLSDLNSWFNNFESCEEKYLASAILDSIIYRSQDAVKAFSSQLFHVLLPQILEEKNILKINNISSWMSELDSSNARSIVPIRFTTIEGVDNKTGKSGQTLIREIQREYFDKELIISINILSDKDFILKASNSIKCIVIIDDILCTGTQLETFVKKYKIEDSPFYFIYCPLAAMEDALNKINSTYKNICIEPIEIITDENCFFNKNNNLLNAEHKDGYKYFEGVYLELCSRVNKKMTEPLGFGKKGLTYFFNHSTPNNNLELITHKTKSWNKLVAR